MGDSDVIALAKKFVAAIEAGDIDVVKSCYASDAKIWHNYDEIDQTPEDNLKVLSWMTGVLTDRKYDILRRVEIPGGFMQQHVLRGKLKNGNAFSMPACLVVLIEGGKIKRLEEYLDIGQAAALRG